jgi:hypothetical protein
MDVEDREKTQAAHKTIEVVVFNRIGTPIKTLFLAKNFLPDVGPEFLEDVIEDSGFHLRSPVRGCTLARVLGAQSRISVDNSSLASPILRVS